MKLIGRLILLGAVSALVFSLPHARGQQALLDKTTLGSSQNDSRDLVNSLVPGPQRYGKGEKKQEVNAAELKSKTNKDTTFGGSLLNMGIGGAQPKLDEQQKRHLAPSEEAKPSTESKAATAKDSKPSSLDEKRQASFSNLSVTATLADSLSQEDAEAKSESKGATAPSSTSEAADKQQRSTSSAATDEKPSAASTEKSSAAKSDGGEH
jgi:hypothetical protein